jgi:hypothetical protein
MMDPLIPKVLAVGLKSHQSAWLNGRLIIEVVFVLVVILVRPSESHMRASWDRHILTIARLSDAYTFFGSHHCVNSQALQPQSLLHFGLSINVETLAEPLLSWSSIESTATWFKLHQTTFLSTSPKR